MTREAAPRTAAGRALLEYAEYLSPRDLDARILAIEAEVAALPAEPAGLRWENWRDPFPPEAAEPAGATGLRSTLQLIWIVAGAADLDEDRPERLLDRLRDIEDTCQRALAAEPAGTGLREALLNIVRWYEANWSDDLTADPPEIDEARAALAATPVGEEEG